jgi:chromosome segregation ATPase
MSTANLTAADLAELETRMAALERSILDAPGAAETPTVDAWQAVATTTALLTALREARAERDKALQQCMEANAHLWQEKRKAENERDEARALVEALVEYEPATWGGVDGDNCYWCDRLIRQHAPDCAWDAARKARDAWKGNE